MAQMKRKGHSNSNTRNLILEVAGEIFAECGFRGATVRTICERAGVNVSAIKYYFGGKEEMYSEVLKYWHKFAIKKYPPLLDVSEKAPLEDQLRAFIRSLLSRLLDRGKPAWFGKLMAREMTEPTRVFERLVKENILPLNMLLASIVGKIIGVPVGEEEIRLCCASIIGQCLYYYHARSMMARFYQRDVSNPDEIERIADHITQFSLKSLKYYSEKDLLHPRFVA